MAVYGVRGTIALIISAIAAYTARLNPERRRAIANLIEKDRAFDRLWGVNTCGTAIPATSDVVGPNWVYGLRYQGCDTDALEGTLRKLAIRYEDFTFVDLGSGKGRALLVSAQFPFKRIIGVEYSGRLNDIARRNIAQLPESKKMCKDIALFCSDAGSFPIPEGPVLIFLYNPFGRPVMEEVVRNVCLSFEKDPRRMVVVYFTPLFGDLWRKVGFLAQAPSSEAIAIFDTESIANWPRDDGKAEGLVEGGAR